jgi:GNAT superfamily N-acetyltransferase
LRLFHRDAAPGDAPTLALMNRRLIEDERHVNPMGLPELEARLRDWLERGEYRAALFFTDEFTDVEREVGAEPDGAADSESDVPAGYVLYQLRRDYYFPERDVVYVRHFYVERGRRRQGIGRLAFETIARERFPAGATLDLEVLATNPVGREFWTSLGFEPRYTAMRREPR